MADVNLFQLGENVTQLKEEPFANEKELQRLMEKNLEAFFNIKFLATEHSTGSKHRGRIDTLGLDENNCPVIIEYKVGKNQNVINQGLYYLDWLLDHKADFQLLVYSQLGPEIEIDWGAPRLVCLAENYTKFDEHAVQQINRNIELYRYKKYAGNILLIELVNVVQAERKEVTVTPGDEPDADSKTVADTLEGADPELKQLFLELEEYLYSLGDDVQKKELKHYYAFKRIRNFACVEVKPQLRILVIHVKVDLSMVGDELPYFAKDVSNVGHWGTGNLQLKIKTLKELDLAKRFVEMSYNDN